MSTPVPYVGRLAPSPTGWLHLGHAATFLTAHARARERGGRLLLRIDDLDAQRSKRTYIEAAREDLSWLGISWDKEVHESSLLPLYAHAMRTLLAEGYAYPCTCSRKDLVETTQAPHEGGEDEPVYSGRCRFRDGRASHEPAPGTNYRFRVPDGQTIAFEDGRCGPQRFLAGAGPQSDFGDFLIWRKDGLPSYQLACAVDDAHLQITEVVRGRDLLKSTARQTLLQQALGLRTPEYFHTELVRNSAGQRLAKRYDALSLRAFREKGFSAGALREQLSGVAFGRNVHHSKM